MLLADISYGGQVVLAVIPVIATAVMAAFGYVATRILKQHDDRLQDMKDDIKELDNKVDQHNVNLALLVAGDVKTDAEISLLRKRYHVLAGAMQAVQLKLHLQGIDIEAEES